MIYFITLFLLIILSVHYDINGQTKYRNQWYFAVQAILILIAGLRYRLGDDTINYIYEFYHVIPELRDLSIDEVIMSGIPPLWLLLNSIIKTIGWKFFVVQLIEATIVNVLILKYFRKHSLYPFLCVALYFFWRYQWYNMMIMKAAIALSIILYANDYFLEKKYTKGLFLILIATGFHQSSILLVVVPFLTFLRFNISGVFLLACVYLFGVFLQSMLGDVFKLMELSEGLSTKLDGYVESGGIDQLHDFNFFIVNYVPIIIYPILSLIYIKYKCKNSKLIRLEPFVMIGLMFQMIQFSVDIFYRYIYIYSLYYIPFIVHFFVEFSRNSGRLKGALSYIRSFIIVMPLLASFAYSRPLTYVIFYPYSSIMDKSINRDREKFFSERMSGYKFNLDEY